MNATDAKNELTAAMRNLETLQDNGTLTPKQVSGILESVMLDFNVTTDVTVGGTTRRIPLGKPSKL